MAECLPVLKKRLGALAATCAVVLLLASTVAAGEYSVLVLHSYHPGQQWSRSVQEGILDVFDQSSLEIALRTEYMDTKRLNDEEHQANLLATFRHKFAKRRFDVVISSDNNALDFIMRHGRELFPGTPVVFCGVNDYTPELIKGYPEITGAAEAVAFEEGIEVVLQMQPGVRRVCVYGSDSATWQRHKVVFENAVRRFAGKIELIVLEGMDIPLAREHIAGLGDGDAVLLTNLYRDAEGKMTTFAHAARAITTAGTVPAYGFWDFQLGHGIVGGKLISGRAQGETAARLALEVLGGTPASSIPVITESPNQNMFDYLQLKRLDMDMDLVPEGSVVINNPLSFYRANRSLVHLGIGVVVALTAIIMALLTVLGLRRRTEQRIKANEEYYRGIFNSINDAIFVHDAGSGEILDVNETMRRMFLCSKEEALESHVGELSDAESGYVVERASELIGRAVREGPQVFEWRCKSKNGSRFWAEAALRFFSIEGEGKVLAVLRNIDERKEAERVRKQLIAELEDKNAELERFTYTVSHDLKSPIITIKGVVGMLEADIAEGEVARIENDLKRIDGAAGNMLQLLDELLELSRIGRKDNPHTDVDLGELVAAVAELLEGRLHSSGINLTIMENLPTVRGDRGRLQEVFQNLLDNAAKFVKDSPEPRIEVGGREDGGEQVIYVADNGIGIEPKYAERVFDLFEKLNPKVEGTGIGLALVRRIVEHHGGRVWVESFGKGKGARFCFTLSVPPEGQGTGGTGAGPVEGVRK